MTREEAIDILKTMWQVSTKGGPIEEALEIAIEALEDPENTEPAIPLSWIEAKIDWLISLDNDFSILTAGQMRAVVNMWKDEQKEGE